MNNSATFYTLRFTVYALLTFTAFWATLSAIAAVVPTPIEDPSWLVLGLLFGGLIVAVLIPAILAGRTFYAKERRSARLTEALSLSPFFAAGSILALVVVITAADLIFGAEPAAYDYDRPSIAKILADGAIVFAVGFVVLALALAVLFWAVTKRETRRAAKAG